MNQFKTNINNKSMEDVIIQRIKSFFRNNNLKNRNVAQLLNISETTLNNKLNGTRSLDLSTLQNIIIHFEMLSTEWLLRGDGSMYKSENTTQEAGQIATGENVETIVDRIRKIINDKSQSVTSFSKMIGVAQTTVNNYLKYDRSPSYEVLESIVVAFPDVSAEWLLLGQGPMYKSENTTQAPNQAEENISGKATMNVLIKTIEYYQKEVERLVENIDELRNENEILKSELERNHLENERV